MVKRKLATLTASLALLVPAGAMALGLGNISMNSALDQHLKAEILIHSASTNDLDELTVDIASAAVFAQYGIERPASLDELQFEVIKVNGETYVQLTSLNPIREPFLNFLVEAKWPSGHVLRQFTVLVDPPTMMKAVPVQVSSARVAEPAPLAVKSRIENKASVSGVIKPSLSVDRATGAIEYGPSKANDTLWGVAKQMRGNHDVSVHQVMLAILRDNPEAFYRGNVNNLRMGHVLRINDIASITSISTAAASREVSRQYQEWKTGKSIPASPVVNKPLASTVASGNSAQLKLVSAGETANTLGVGGTSEGVSEGLALANEQLLANREETTALEGRLVKLEEQIQSLQRLVQLKDDQLASVQQTGQEKQQPKPQPRAQLKPEEPVASGLFDSPLVLGLIALIIGGLGFLGYTFVRNRKQVDYQESILSQSVGAPVSEMPVIDESGNVNKGRSSGDMDVASGLGGESSLLTDFSANTMEGLQTDIGEIDPISEADVYLAYGRYSQAEEILVDALKTDDSREEYHSKLLEVYHAAGEKEKFLEAAEKFHASSDKMATNPAWSKVCAMGLELLPGAALFAATAAGSAAIAETSQLLGEVEILESEQAENNTNLSDELPIGNNNILNLGSTEDELKNDELDSFDISALEDSTESLIEDPLLDESFSELLDDQADIEIKDDEGIESTESNSLEFDLEGFSGLDSDISSDEQASQQQLDDDIADNSLEFGVLNNEPVEEGAASSDVADVDSGTDLLNLDEEAVELAGSDDLDLTSSLEEMASELDSAAAGSVEVDVSTDDLDLTSSLDEMAAELDSAAGDDLDSTSLDDMVAELDLSASSNDNQADSIEIQVDDLNDDSHSDDAKKNQADELADIESLDLGTLVDLDDDNSDFDDDNPFADLDEVGTKLDLARAYVDMGDKEGAQSIVDEVMQEGTDEQKEQAQALLSQL